MSARERVLVATRNAGKLRELVPILEAHGWEAIGLDAAGIAERPEIELSLESGETFRENALVKAHHFHSLSGLPTLADDSGLVVDALGGEPGVHSKRWSNRPDLSGAALDAANNVRLLEALSGAATRAARYVCAAAWVDDEAEFVALGRTTGRILDAAQGALGFGYDPLFFSDDLSASFGEVSTAEKGRVSHRGRAVAALLKKIRRGS